MEVKRLGSDGRFVHPGFPVDSGEDLVGLEAVEVLLNEFLPGVSEVDCLDAGKEVLLQVGLEEVLHLHVTDQGVHVGEELETLFVGNLRETVVGVVAFEDRV